MSEHFQTHFIVNPHSAGGHTGRVWPQIERAAREVIPDFTVSMTEGMMHAVELTRAALKAGAQMVVSVGGDGTNNEVVNGFFERGQMINPQAVFGVVCSGTGSDLIRTIHIPRDFREAVKLLAGKTWKATDVGRMTLRDHRGQDVERYFINIASFGVGGLADEMVNSTTKALGGKVSFIVGCTRAALKYRNQLVRLRLDDGEEMERRIFNVAVANGQYHGAGMRTAPAAAVDDGLFDVAILGDLSFFEQLGLMRTIYRGAHIGRPKIESFRARKVEAFSEERVLLDVDGEQPGTLPASFELLPGILRVKRP